MENFELTLADRTSVLLLGKNGVGKSAVGFALRTLQRIARGENRIRDLVDPGDFAHGRTQAPMRFEIEAKIDDQTFKYAVAFDFPDGFKELRICEESLFADGQALYDRELAQVRITSEPQKEARFNLDWHLAALPIIQRRTSTDPLSIFREWLARMIILRPVPHLIDGASNGETLYPKPDGTDIGAWFSALFTYSPKAYAEIDEYLREIMPDLLDIKNPATGKDSKSLEVSFSQKQQTLTVPFKNLSDGEKCFAQCAMVLAAAKVYGPLVCFWDEPDAHLASSEIGHFVMALRKRFASGGQFIATSHHPETIRRFSRENIIVLDRRSHFDPTQVRPLSELKIGGDLVGSILRGEVEI